MMTTLKYVKVKLIKKDSMANWVLNKIRFIPIPLAIVICICIVGFVRTL